MSEFATVIVNSQDPESIWNSKAMGEGFKPFGATLNGAMVPHEMDKKTHEDARAAELKPERVGSEGFMVFMFESENMTGVSEWGPKAAGKTTSVRSISSSLKGKAKL